MMYDFSGYATKHGIRCSDGRTIMPDAFKECDGQVVPLVWQHVHDTPDNVLGHAQLENRPDGVYAYCSLNDTDRAKDVAKIIKHKDICALSIYANRLQEVGGNVMHGVIREVSLVLAGANPGATIDNLAFAHSDGEVEISESEACITFVGENSSIELFHADSEESEEEPEEQKGSEKTIGEIIDTMNEEQKQALYAIIGSLTEDEEEAEKAVSHADSDEKKPESEVDNSNVEEVLESLNEEQKKALEVILKAVKSGKPPVEDVADVFDTFSKKQKDAVYFLAGAIMNKEDGSKGEEHSEKEEAPDDEKKLSHADKEGSSDEETIGAILDTLDETQKKAVSEILDAIGDGTQKVPEETAKIFDSLSDKQKDAVYALVGIAVEADGAPGSKNQNGSENEEVKHSDNEGETMKYNVFDAQGSETELKHADIEGIFADAKVVGSLKEAVLQHGIADIEVLFPEAQAVNNEPYQITRRMEWVGTVLGGVHKSPFARIKSTAASLTEDQARAKGYVKGRKKIEEQITALRRITTPQTVYKLQKLDRDDILDITDFDVVAFMKKEMRMMLDEEIARAILVGDGRLTSDPEKILPAHIRPVWSDDEMYTIHKVIATADANDYTKIIDEVVRSRKDYKGSGNPIMFIGPDMLTEMRLLKDNDNRFRYESDAKLAEAMRVSKIEEVEIFDDLVRTVSGKDRKLVAIILNLADYTVGTNKGGEVTMFDDFDIDYNKMAYLIETRIAGALTMPKSAIAIEIQTTQDSDPDPVYVKVQNPVTADIDDYYDQDEYGRFAKTVDVAVVTGKDYFELSE